MLGKYGEALKKCHEIERVGSLKLSNFISLCVIVAFFFVLRRSIRLPQVFIWIFRSSCSILYICSYCVRKMTLCAYVKVLRFEDTLKQHRYFTEAAKLAASVSSFIIKLTCILKRLIFSFTRML